MKKMLTHSRLVAAPLLMSCCAYAVAQSLGTPSAEVWLGRPLDMTVPARFISNDSRDECVRADVFFGESRVPADLVRTTIVGSDAQRRVRIVTDSPVDEPIVTVSLRAGCASSITRNYTLLPDIPSEALLASLARPPSLPVAAGNVPLPGTVVAAAPAAPLRITRTTAPRQGTAPAPTSGSLKDIVAQARKAVGEGPAPVRTAKAFRADAPAAGGPRLRLEPIEMQEQAMLRVSASLAAPGGDASQRATAALLWQAINADPQELLRTTAMLQKLEGDLAQLRLAATATRNEMAALRRRLDEAQPWYASATLVQALALLLLATGAAAGMLWFRARRAGAMLDPWHAGLPAVPPQPVQEPVAAAPEEVAVAQPEPAPARRLGEVSAPGELAPALPVVAALPSEQPVRAETGPIDFEVEVPQLHELPQRRATTGALRVETLAATFEEVEFLSSLGLTSDAMDVLKAYLHDSNSPAPLAFFELMRLCDEGEDATAIGTVRRRYVQAFGVEAPRLEQLAAPIGLEQIPHLSGSITRAWGTSRALDLIEEALFKVPDPGAALTLQAGRDLICLYDVAMALAAESSGLQTGSDAESHALAPWANAEDAIGAQVAAQAVAEAQGGLHFALDVDLGVAPEELPEKQDPDHDLAPLLAEMQAQAAREKARLLQEEDAFSAAVASERAPVSRY